MISDKLLIVDDDPRISASIKLLFPEFEVFSVPDGTEALKILEKPNDIDLILLDICMRGMDGLTVLGEIRKIRPDIPVIMMTAFGTMDIAIQALRQRAHDFIEKPFNPDLLRDKIYALLKENASLEEDAHEPENRRRRILKFIDRNVTQVSLGAISEMMCLSSRYLSRLFIAQNGECYRDYKVNIKIERAKELLANSSMAVFEISNKLGYENPETFMRMFKRRTGQTPTHYRQIAQAKNLKKGKKPARPC